MRERSRRGNGRERNVWFYPIVFNIVFLFIKKKEEKYVVGEAVMEYWERANNITVEE